MTFNVEFHPKAYKEAQDLLRMNPDMATKFREYLMALSEEPYKFPKKNGKLKQCRGLNFQVKGESWRLVFRIFEKTQTIQILAIGCHDDAYSSAQNRV